MTSQKSYKLVHHSKLNWSNPFQSDNKRERAVTEDEASEPREDSMS